MKRNLFYIFLVLLFTTEVFCKNHSIYLAVCSPENFQIKVERRTGNLGFGFSPGIINYFWFINSAMQETQINPMFYLSYYYKFKSRLYLKPDLGIGYGYYSYEEKVSQDIDIIKSHYVSIIPGINFEWIFIKIKFGIKYGSYVKFYRSNNRNPGVYSSSEEYDKYHTIITNPKHAISLYFGFKF